MPVISKAEHQRLDDSARKNGKAWLLYFRDRRYAGKDETELARDLGLATSTINGITQGDRMPGITVLLHMSRLFEISLDSLMKDPVPFGVEPAPGNMRAGAQG